MTQEFWLFITLLLPQYSDKIIAELVKSGYQVKGSLSDGKNPNMVSFTYNDTSPSILLCLSVICNKDTKVISEDLLSIFKNEKMKIYSYVVVQPTIGKGTAGACNFQLDRTRKPKRDLSNIDHLKLIAPPQEEKKAEDENP